MTQQDHSLPKVAIVCDWLTNMGGAEKVVLAFHKAFPDAPIYTSTYNPDNMPAFHDIDIRTTYLQRLPKFIRNLHKFMPMLRVHAFRKLDLSEYDIILSSSSAEAKQVRKTRNDQVHICYCHTPIRYYWSHYEEYKADPGFGKLNWLVRLIMPLMVPSLKKADYKAAQAVDYFIGNSTTVKERIEHYYHQPAQVIFPPVDTKRFSPAKKRADYYMALSRHIPYKKIDLAIAAANKLKIPLRVYGTGSERAKHEAMAGPTVQFFEGSPSPEHQAEITEGYTQAKGFIFPAEEDFGISPVEAIAGGSPVIAYGKGGALDIVHDKKTGIFFTEQTVDAIVDAIKRAEATTFSPEALHDDVSRFDESVFIAKIQAVVNTAYRQL